MTDLVKQLRHLSEDRKDSYDLAANEIERLWIFKGMYEKAETEVLSQRKLLGHAHNEIERLTACPKYIQHADEGYWECVGCREDALACVDIEHRTACPVVRLSREDRE